MKVLRHHSCQGILVRIGIFPLASPSDRTSVHLRPLDAILEGLLKQGTGEFGRFVEIRACSRHNVHGSEMLKYSSF